MYWVFNEEQLKAALEEFVAEAVDGGSIIVKEDIEKFLYSDVARKHKLRMDGQE